VISATVSLLSYVRLSVPYSPSINPPCFGRSVI
jgi:hypothetical protein